MGKILLEGLDFFAYHGYFAEEQKIGNRYTVTLQVEVDFNKAAENDELKETIDYSDLYTIVKLEMNTPSKLMEHIARNIIISIYKQYKKELNIEIKISKHNPSIGGLSAVSSVIMTSQDLPRPVWLTASAFFSANWIVKYKTTLVSAIVKVDLKSHKKHYLSLTD